MTAEENEALRTWLVEMVRLCRETGRPVPPHDTMIKLTKVLINYHA
jgi:hypothetical protein